MSVSRISKILVLRLTFCIVLVIALLTLSLTSSFNNYGESSLNANAAEAGSHINFYSAILNPSASIQGLNTSQGNVSSELNGAVIIMFDRAYDTQFLYAKPILDKYGFKASFFVICSFVEGTGYHKLSNGSELYHNYTNSMHWDQIRQLYKEGHDVQSHGLEHRDLRKLSIEGLEREIGGSKECLEEGLKPAFFQLPSNKGHDNITVLNMVSKFFDYGLSDHSKLMFLKCDCWVNHGYKTQSYKYQYDCNPFNADGTPTRTNKYSIREWSHDREHTRLNEKNPHLEPHGAQMSDLLFNEFVSVVESQNIYNNKAGKIVAIPIIGYDFVGDSSKFDTSTELFEREMEFLYNNGYQVLKFSDLGYNDVDLFT